MAIRAPSAVFAWLAWLLAACGWILMLSGLSALQRNCGSSPFSVFGTAGYLSPSGCEFFYNYSWWTLWYQFAMLIIIPVFLALGWVHKWRMGLIGLLIPIIVLLQYTCDTSLGLWQSVSASNSQDAQAKTLFVGSLLAVIFLYVEVILFGVFDEKEAIQAGSWTG